MNDELNKFVIKDHEGRRLKAYRDTRGLLTVGDGFNLDSADAQKICGACGVDYARVRAGEPITDAQCDALFSYQYGFVQDQARRIFAAIDTWPENAAAVVCDMIFQLGLMGFSKFRNMITCLRAQDWKGAAREMESSLLARQTPNRVQNNVLLLNGIS